MHTIYKIVACEKEKNDRKKIAFHEYTLHAWVIYKRKYHKSECSKANHKCKI